jgi:hypothetical protein
MTSQYHRIGCEASHAPIGSLSISHMGLDVLIPYFRSPTMFKDLVHRTWRLAITVGPLVAIALSLAAGLKWR